jgi:hypothetical protein
VTQGWEAAAWPAPCRAAGMDTTAAHHALAAFRRDLYEQALGHRKDSVFELLEAALVGPAPATLVRLSLAPVFRRRWPSACDALADGMVDADRCRRLVRAAAAATDRSGGRPVWAADGTTWPRPAARASPERTWGHRTTPGFPQDGVVPAWEYEWLVAVPEPRGSWVLPLDVRRRGPAAGTPTAVTIGAIGDALAAGAAGAARPVVALDSSYEPVGFARADLAADVLIRLRANRKFFRAPGPYSGRGAPRKHGPVFKLGDPATHGPPDAAAVAPDPTHGEIRVDVWRAVHVQGGHDAPFDLVRIAAARLPRRDRPPKPLWLAWIGGPLPDDLLDLWRWYGQRFTLEHGCRFLKQALGWTTVRPADPAAADRWTWLLALALWQLWLARPLVADRRLPWERAGPPAPLSPGRVRRAFPGLLPGLGGPARPPKPRGKSPGRRPGERPGPRTRHPVARRSAKRAA